MQSTWLSFNSSTHLPLLRKTKGFVGLHIYSWHRHILLFIHGWTAFFQNGNDYCPWNIFPRASNNFEYNQRSAEQRNHFALGAYISSFLVLWILSILRGHYFFSLFFLSYHATDKCVLRFQWHNRASASLYSKCQIAWLDSQYILQASLLYHWLLTEIKVYYM